MIAAALEACIYSVFAGSLWNALLWQPRPCMCFDYVDCPFSHVSSDTLFAGKMLVCAEALTIITNNMSCHVQLQMIKLGCLARLICVVSLVRT